MNKSKLCPAIISCISDGASLANNIEDFGHIAPSHGFEMTDDSTYSQAIKTHYRRDTLSLRPWEEGCFRMRKYPNQLATAGNYGQVPQSHAQLPAIAK